MIFIRHRFNYLLLLKSKSYENIDSSSMSKFSKNTKYMFSFFVKNRLIFIFNNYDIEPYFEVRSLFFNQNSRTLNKESLPPSSFEPAFLFVRKKTPSEPACLRRLGYREPHNQARFYLPYDIFRSIFSGEPYLFSYIFET